jgi:hypothetical protein
MLFMLSAVNHLRCTNTRLSDPVDSIVISILIQEDLLREKLLPLGAER